MKLIILIIVVAFSVISTWVVGIQMRRKIKKDLGRKATDSDLTSIDTWMKVEEVEEKNAKDKPLDPS